MKKLKTMTELELLDYASERIFYLWSNQKVKCEAFPDSEADKEKEQRLLNQYWEICERLWKLKHPED